MSAIYALSDKPTALEIIKRSVVAHPSTFRQALINQAETHHDSMALTSNARAASGAKAMFNACLAAYDYIGRDDLDAEDKAMAICSSMGPAIIALNVACKLQCLPPHIRTQAALTIPGAVA